MPAAIPMIVGAVVANAVVGTTIAGVVISSFGASLIGGIASIAASNVLGSKPKE